MSIQTLYTAATGMESLQTKLDVISNNLANVNTGAFKRGRANFEDLFYRQEVLPGALDSAGQLTPTGTAIGLGSKVQSVQTDFRQGAFQQTGNPLDVAIVGDGFFQVKDPSGETMYTRTGNFSMNSERQARDGLGFDRPLDRTGNQHSQRCDGHRDQPAGSGFGIEGRSAGVDAGRPIPARSIHQPRRLAEAGRKSVFGNRRRRSHRHWQSWRPPRAWARYSRIRWKPRTSSQ